MLCSWEGNRRSGVVLAMHDRLRWFIHLRSSRPKEGIYRYRWLGSWVVSVLDSGTEGPGFKSQSQRSGNSLRQTAHAHRASVHQAAQLVAALLRIAGVTAGLVESNGSLPPGLWLTSPAGWLPRTGISSRTLRSVIEYGLPLPLFYPTDTPRGIWQNLLYIYIAQAPTVEIDCIPTALGYAAHDNKQQIYTHATKIHLQT